MDSGKDKTIIREFTAGSIPKSLLLFMLPFMASNAFQVLYSAVDMVIVGRYVGSRGLSAISTCSMLLNCLTMLCSGICTGAQVLIAQMVGAKKRGELGEAIGSLTWFMIVTSVISSVLIAVFHRPILMFMRIPAEAYHMADQYMLICGTGMIFSFGYNMVSTVLRGMGDSKHPFWFIMLASFINLALDLLFTGRMGLGVAGAAAATVIGQAVSLIVSIVFLYRVKDKLSFRFSIKMIRPNMEYLRIILSQGVPAAIHSGAIYFSMFYVNRLVNMGGVIASAAFGIGVKIDDVCGKISIGVRYAATPMVAQNYAAGNIPRTRQIVYWTWLYSILFHLVFLAVYLIFPREMFSLFTSEPAVLEMAPIFVNAIKYQFIGLAINRGANAHIQGIGFSKLGMVLGIFDGVILRIGLSYLFGIVMGMGFEGFVLGYGLAVFGVSIPSTLYFFFGKWENRRSLVKQ